MDTSNWQTSGSQKFWTKVELSQFVEPLNTLLQKSSLTKVMEKLSTGGLLEFSFTKW